MSTKNITKSISKNLSSKVNNKNLIKYMPYIITGYIANRYSYAYRVSDADNAMAKLLDALGNGKAFGSILPSIHPIDLLIGVIAGAALAMALYMKKKDAYNFRKGVEYGSAKWGKPEDILPYMDKDDFENNILLTQTERLQLNGRPSSPKYARNKNVEIIGGSGSGKTRFYVKPQLMQMHSSYCVTDPKGTILIECGKMLYDHGYKIKILNTINFKKSCHYNPFAYIRSEKDILKMVNTIILNTKGEGEKSAEDFWVSTTCSQAVKSLRTA